MSKITALKLARLFEQGKHPSDIARRVVPLKPLNTLAAGICQYCGFPVYASHGQLLKWVEGKDGEHLYSHKKCRP